MFESAAAAVMDSTVNPGVKNHKKKYKYAVRYMKTAYIRARNFTRHYKNGNTTQKRTGGKMFLFSGVYTQTKPWGSNSGWSF